MAKKVAARGIADRNPLRAWTAGGRRVRTKDDPRDEKTGKRLSERQINRNAWDTNSTVNTYTTSKSGKLAIDGGKNVRDAATWAMTPKNDDGTPVLGKSGKARQSGRSMIANRRQRDYDNRRAMNNITARTVQRWRDLGWVRDVNGSIVGDGENVRGIAIHQKADGNYSMGLTTG